MRKILFFCILFFFAYSAKTQVNQVTIGALNVTLVFNSVRYDPSDGGTINVGYINDPVTGTGNDCFMVKLNGNQQIVWQKIISNTGDDYFNQVIVCANGDYMAVGQLTQGGVIRGFACRIDKTNGDIIWSSASANSPVGEKFYDVVETVNGNIAISGTDTYSPNLTNIFIVLLNSAGVNIWSKVSSYSNSDEPLAINQLPNGNLIIGAFEWVGHYNAIIMEFNELTGAVISENLYQISIPAPNSSVSLNSLWPISIKIINGEVIFNISAFQGIGSNSCICIYTYDQVTKGLTGNIYYHTGDVNSIGYTYTPLGANDFLMAQSFTSPNRVYVSRITNGSVVYDDLINSSVLSIYEMNTRGANVVYCGKDDYNAYTNTYNLFSSQTDPATDSPCSITGSNTLVLQPSTLNPTATTDISLSPVTALNALSLTAQPSPYTLNSICGSVLTEDTIINDYTEVINFDICTNEIIVADAAKYNPGDTVLIIQMKGAVIDSANAGTFGTISDYKNSGNYEMNIVQQKTGNSLSLLNVLQRQYDVPAGKVQLVRAPYYKNITLNKTLTCLPWDGSKGGIVVLNVENTATLNADIDVTGKGFKGGNSPNPNTTTLYCNNNEYYYPSGTAAAAAKGESVANTGNAIAWGKGSPANGGGGGNGHNSGGGGGSNGGAGGFGGYQLDACGGSATDNRGLGGKALIYNTAANKIFMGGGGGSGHTDNNGGSPMNGGDGGGIIIIKSPVINAGSFKIIARGGDAPQCGLSPIDLCHDGSGGGGGAGTVLIDNTNLVSGTAVDIRGGKGGDLAVYFTPNATSIGPGGGGGAGVFWTNNNSLPSNITVNGAGGINGVIVPHANDPYGTTPGQAGINVFNLTIPVDTVLFKKNIDSVRIKDSLYNCSSYNFEGLPFTETSPVVSWAWSFGDNTTGTMQNTSHTYATAGTYAVKLVGTDINGCKDSISGPFATSVLNIIKSNDTVLCGTSPVQLFAGGGASYSWIPASALDNPNIFNPVATPATTTIYRVTVTNTDGCSKMDSIKITVNNLPVISKSNDTAICNKSLVQLFAGGGSTYLWAPALTLNNAGIFNPVATPVANTTYYVTVTTAAGCFKTDSVKISIQPSPVVTKSNDTIICLNSSVQLLTGGGGTYSWTPVSSLNNASISNPVASPVATTFYHVTVTNAAGCTNTDSIKVTVNNLPVVTKSGDKSICDNSPVQLFATGGAIYSWAPAATLSNPNIANPVATPGATTTYYVTVTNAAGCPAIDSVKISTSPPPVITKSNDTDICKNTSVQLFAAGGSTYSWTPVSSLNNAAIANPVSTPNTFTTYYVTVTNAAGCSATDSVKIGINPVPVITASNDTTICSQASAALHITGGSSYLWSPASSLDDPASASPVASPSVTTLYKVTVTDTRSCNYEDSVKVSIRSAAVFTISPDVSVCSGKPQQLQATGGDSYIWTPASGLNDPNLSSPVATPNGSTTYTVTIHESTCNETGVLATNLTILPALSVKASSSNDLTCSLSSSQLIATGAANYVWTPATGLNNNSIANPVATPANTIIYKVTGTNIDGCTGSDTVTVKVNYNIASLYLMPNSFTPNNDGINDCFGIKYWGTVEELDFSIYNRFGEKVFHTNDPAMCWDGTYKQEPQNANIFVYIIKAKTACGNVNRKGIVALIK